MLLKWQALTEPYLSDAPAARDVDGHVLAFERSAWDVAGNDNELFG